MDEKTSGSSSGSEIFLVWESIIWFCSMFWKNGDVPRTFSWAAKIRCSCPTTRVTIAEMDLLEHENVRTLSKFDALCTLDDNLLKRDIRCTCV